MTAQTEEAPSARSAAAPTTSPASTADAAFIEFLDLDAPRRSSMRRRSGWWRIGFPLVLVLLFAAVPVLVYAGIHVVLQSNHGRLIAATSDPSQPGWEAAVEPTPTAVLATVNDDGQLSSVSVLALTSDGVGSVIFVAADPQMADTPGYKTMVDAY